MRRKSNSPYNFESSVQVQFHEVDSLNIVWHGHYIRYFELGREAFGEKYGMGYRALRAHNTAVPVVSVHCEYKRPLTYGDHAIIKAYFIESMSAKVIFEYEIFHAETKDLIAVGRTEQVFTKPETGELILLFPDFYKKWLEELKNSFA